MKAIKEFDEIVGKTVLKAEIYLGEAFITFTDGTYTILEGHAERPDGDVYIEPTEDSIWAEKLIELEELKRLREKYGE